MTTDERIYQLFVEANPIPDVESLGTGEAGAAGYLATLEQRSSEMTDTKTKILSGETKSKRPILALAAGAVGVLLVFALFGPRLIGTEPAAPGTERAIGYWKFTEIADDRLDILSGGMFSILKDRVETDTGAYDLSGERIVFVTESGVDCAAGDTGTYSLDFVGPDAMRLSLVNDDCVPRGVNLDGARFIRHSGRSEY